jgi:hypothetical protein
MSLKLITCGCSADFRNIAPSALAYVLVLEMLQQLQLSICSLGQDWRAERLHDFLNRHRLPSELILRRAARSCQNALYLSKQPTFLPDKSEGSHADRLKVSVSMARSVCLLFAAATTVLGAHLLVISKVVPKICARTNSAILNAL